MKKGPVEDSFGIWTGEKSGIDYVNKIRDEAEQRLEESVDCCDCPEIELKAGDQKC